MHSVVNKMANKLYTDLQKPLIAHLIFYMVYIHTAALHMYSKYMCTVYPEHKLEAIL